MKTNTVFQKYQAIQKIGTEVSIPFNVWRILGHRNQKIISIFGDDISFGEDFGSLEEVRAAISWYAEQMGGKVKWEKE